MTDFALKPKTLPAIVYWKVAVYEKGKYKNHPRKFYIKSSAEQFAKMLKDEGKYERVEVRDIYKNDGL